MKKKHIIIFLIVSLVNIIFRFITLNSGAVFLDALCLVILPFVYAFLSLYFIKIEWEAALIDLAALTATAFIFFIYAIFTKNILPLTEFVYVILQLPSLLTSLFAAHATFTIPNKGFKILFFTLSLIVVIAIACFFNYFMSATIGMASSKPEPLV